MPKINSDPVIHLNILNNIKKQTVKIICKRNYKGL